MTKPNSLKRNIIFLLFFWTILPIAFLSFGLFYTSIELNKENIRYKFLKESSETINYLQMQIGHIVARTESLAMHPNIKQMVMGTDNKKTNFDLKNLIKSDKTYVDILVVDKDGKVINSSNRANIDGNLSKHELFINTKNGKFYQNTNPNSKLFGLSGLVIAYPILDINKNSIGSFVAIVSWEKIEYLLSKYTIFNNIQGKSVFIRLIDDVSQSTIYQSNNYNKYFSSNSKFYKKAENMIDFVKVNNHEYLISSVYTKSTPMFDNPDWCLTFYVDTNILYSGMNNLGFVFASVIMGVSLLIALIGLRFVNSIVSPIKQLAKKMRITRNNVALAKKVVKSGKISFENDVNFKYSDNDFDDEISELTYSFDTLTSRLDKQFYTLETKNQIDKLILSSVQIRDVVSLVINNIPKIVKCDYIGIVIVKNDDEPSEMFYKKVTEQNKEVECINVIISSKNSEWLNKDETILIENSNYAPKFLNKLNWENQYYLFMPIHLDLKLVGLLVLGNIDIPKYTHEDLNNVSEIGDRIKSAISHSSWEDKLYFQAHHDALTKLPNRLLFQARLEHALLRSEREEHTVALFFIDLDKFKDINDTLGHDVGDSFLTDMARRLTSCMRKVDTVARLGGDEFTIIVPDIPKDNKEALRASLIAEKILKVCTLPYEYNDEILKCSASIGISLYPYDADSVPELIKCADMAMYEAKREGKKTYRFYSASINQQAKQRFQIEDQLRKSIDCSQLVQYFQPIYNIKSNEIVAIEAFIKWQHPEIGLLGFSDFVEVAEQSGFIYRMGEWVIQNSLKELKELHNLGYSNLKVSINLSFSELNDNRIVDVIKLALQKFDVKPEYLQLEILPKSVVQDKMILKDTLQKLSKMGISIILEGFGCVDTSILNLKHLPINGIKIDQSFIKKMGTKIDNATILMALSYLGNYLEFDVIAKGVETKEESMILAESYCRFAQGNYYSAALQSSDLLKILENTKHKVS